jgi:hypothetical protein
MIDEIAPPPETSPLQASHVYAVAIICLVVGLGIGYLMRSSQLAVLAPQHVAVSAPHGALPPGHPHSLEELKQISDQQAAPMLERLKAILAIRPSSHKLPRSTTQVIASMRLPACTNRPSTSILGA